MNRWPSFTVAVLSRKRRKLLRRAVGAVAQLDYPAFEIVVVGDLPEIADYALDPAIARQVRYRRQIEPNVARGRNVALGVAAGDIVAFCDDDAVPEPSWLRALAAAFRREDVAAASGTVLGSDGLTIEWQWRYFASTGRDAPAELPPDGLLFADPHSQITSDRYLGLIGANSAFRRSAVLLAGGFDESYAYFLEETDMAYRLAQNGWSAAFVPGAVVHHLRAQNASRSSANVPRNLFQIAASKAHFCRRHMPAHQIPCELARFRDDRMRSLDRCVRLGTLRADGFRRLVRQLDRGLKAGVGRDPILPLNGCPARPVLEPYQRQPHALRIALVSGWGVQVGRTRRLAQRLVEAGHMVSWFAGAAGWQPARVKFSDGLWLHRGGAWWQSRPGGDDGKGICRGRRALAQIDRVAAHRRFDAIIRPGRAGSDARDGAVDLNLPDGPGPMTAGPPAGSSAIPGDVLQVLKAALKTGRPDRTTRQSGIGRRAAATHGPGPAVFRISPKRYDLPDAPLGHS